MDINTLIGWLTDGLPADQAASVKAAIERDAVKAKVAAVKDQTEYAALEARSIELNAALEGGPEKPGAKAYAKWYEENYPKVLQLQKDYEELQKKVPNTNPTNPNPSVPTSVSEADIQKMVDARIQTQYAPQWSTLLTGTGNIVQKHMFAGRKTPINFEELSKIAPKYNGNLEQAYDEWDKPEREKAETAAREAEIDRRVKEEIQKRGVNTTFPTGADFTPGSLSARSKADVEKFDATSLQRELVDTYLKAGADN